MSNERGSWNLRRVWVVYGLLALLIAGGAYARAASFSLALNEQVRKAKLVAPALGVHVVRVDDGESAYSYNADVLRIAASNTKLPTTAAALDRLGPGFYFETEVWIRGTLRDGALHGDVAIIGGGDPTVSGRHYYGDSYGAFREWAAALQARGIQRVTGDLILVASLFRDDLIHPDWPRNQLTRWYEAPVAPLSFNDNCVLVKVSPGAAVGQPARVETVPPLDSFQIESTASTSSRRGSRVKIGRRLGGNVLTVTGDLHHGARASVDKWVTVEDPVAYFGDALIAAWGEDGLEIAGAVRRKQALDGLRWVRFHVHRTDLLTALEVINKRSQNFYAESVLKVLGARTCGDGSWQGGLQAVREFLDEIGLSDGYRLADGSGMSRKNRLAPAHLTQILRTMANHRWSKEFLRTLPFSGEDGSRWSKRLAEHPYRGNVLAKTGTLNGVSTLSGYAKATSGTLYAFSILCNQARNDWEARAAQDAIVRAIIDEG